MAKTSLLIGTMALAVATAVEAAPPACKKLTAQVYPPPAGKVKKDKSPSFSAAKVADVELGIIAGPGAREVEVFQLRLFTPAGHLYQAIDIPVSVASKHGERARTLRGYPFPVPVTERKAAAGEGKGDEQMSARLPLGGSLISTASLYGRWRAEAWPEDSDRPCASLAFTITP
jgi:hypothetical protein